MFNAKGVYIPQKYTVSEDKIDKRKNVNNQLTNKDGVYGKLNRIRKRMMAQGILTPYRLLKTQIIIAYTQHKNQLL